MSAAAATTLEFHCPRWPGCQCPVGTIRDDCPGITVEKGSNTWLWLHPGSRPDANEAMARALADPTAPSPPRAPDWYREFYNAEYAKAKAEAEARRRRAITAEKLISDMAALDARCTRGLRELAAIATEIAMIRRDMAILHGVPDPAKKEADDADH